MPHSHRFTSKDRENRSKAGLVYNTWKLLDHPASSTNRDELVELIAAQIVTTRLKGSTPRYLKAWNEKKETGTPHPFGELILDHLQDMATGQPIHLEGLVSEHLWHFVSEHTSHLDTRYYKQPPSKSVIDHGGDGFVIHQQADGSFYVRLWEIKKRSQSQEEGDDEGADDEDEQEEGFLSPSSSIRNACKQLKDKGRRYLAQMAVLSEQFIHTPELEELLQELQELWDLGDSRISAGISVAITNPGPKIRPFKSFGTTYLSQLQNNALLGVLITVGCLTQFSEDVKEAIWKGL